MTDKRVEEYQLTDSPGTQVSDDFKLWELIKSGIADRQGIDNRFTDVHHLQSAVLLSRQVLQPLRDEFGPLIPNSVYRSQWLERALKKKPDTWVSTSQHAKGQACDVEVPSIANIDLAQWIYKNLQFDQLILEMYNPAQGPHSGWVHCSFRAEDNRGSLLSFVKQGDKYGYVEGLVSD